jgi:hypothetical protein
MLSPVKYELCFYIPEDDILHSHSRGSLKSYIDKCRSLMSVKRYKSLKLKNIGTRARSERNIDRRARNEKNFDTWALREISIGELDTKKCPYESSKLRTIVTRARSQVILMTLLHETRLFYLCCCPWRQDFFLAKRTRSLLMRRRPKNNYNSL